jgi:hypothetical protein
MGQTNQSHVVSGSRKFVTGVFKEGDKPNYVVVHAVYCD